MELCCECLTIFHTGGQAGKPLHQHTVFLCIGRIAAELQQTEFHESKTFLLGSVCVCVCVCVVCVCVCARLTAHIGLHIRSEGVGDTESSGTGTPAVLHLRYPPADCVTLLGSVRVRVAVGAVTGDEVLHCDCPIVGLLLELGLGAHCQPVIVAGEALDSSTVLWARLSLCGYRRFGWTVACIG